MAVEISEELRDRAIDYAKTMGEFFLPAMQKKLGISYGETVKIVEGLLSDEIVKGLDGWRYIYVAKERPKADETYVGEDDEDLEETEAGNGVKPETEKKFSGKNAIYSKNRRSMLNIFENVKDEDVKFTINSIMKFMMYTDDPALQSRASLLAKIGIGMTGAIKFRDVLLISAYGEMRSVFLKMSNAKYEDIKRLVFKA